MLKYLSIVASAAFGFSVTLGILAMQKSNSDFAYIAGFCTFLGCLANYLYKIWEK